MRAMAGGAAILWLAACSGGASEEDGLASTAATDGSSEATPTPPSPTDPAPPTTTDTAVTTDTTTSSVPSVHWEAVDPGDVPARWGAIVAGDLVAGGLNGVQRGTTELARIGSTALGLTADPVGDLQVVRFCGCALLDTARDELVVVGGRNDTFFDEASIERVAVASGVSESLVPDGAAARPVGCVAFYSEATDLGYVFGGSGSGQLSGATFRYEPATGAFVELDIPGPSPRYDPGVVPLVDGSFLVVGGYAEEGMASDLWHFDPVTETWDEWVADGVAPAGRRFPFLAVDGDHLFYGYGTGSTMGTEVYDDLWSLQLSTVTWEELVVEGPVPSARSFATIVPALDEGIAVMAFGVDGDQGLQTDAWSLRR